MRLAVVIAIVTGLASAAVAEDKPWAKGVSDTEQTRALAIYKDGNTEFGESRFAQALAKYREALTHWDHPAIRFNMAVCLVNLDQPLEAWEHLEHALAFGDAPIGAEIYAQGMTYKKLLLGQLAHLRVTCSEKDAAVTLDGTPLFTCPGDTTRLLTPGIHQVIASKQGFMTETAPIMLPPGKELVHEVKLQPIRVSSRLVRRWKARTPWIFVGTGVGVALFGGLLELQARQEYRTYDQLLSAQCPTGCGPMMPEGQQKVDASSTAHKDRGRLENIAGVSLLVVGGSVAIAGLVGVYLNLPRRVIEHAPMVTPTIGSGGAGASVQWAF